MSFFANLVAGLGTGLGKGLVTEADYQDKLDTQKALQAEKQADKLELQRRDNEMRLELAALKAPGGSGSGGGSDLFNLALLAQKGKMDPDQLEAATRMFSGEAADQMRYVLKGGKTGALPDQAPTEQDVLAAMQYTGAPQPPPDKQLGTADRLKGEQALQRIYTLLRDPAKLDDFAKAEGAFFANDVQASVYAKAIKAGKSEVEAAELASRAADPATYDKNRTNQQRVEASLTNTQVRADGAAGNVGVREDGATLRALEARKAQYLKQLADPTIDDDLKVTLKQEVDDINRRLKAGVQTPAAAPSTSPAKPAQWGASTPTAKPVASVIEKYRALKQP